MFAKQNLINQIRIEAQQKLIKAEIEAKEREQLRISQELHDDIGASLSSMRFVIDLLDRRIEGVPELAESIGYTIQRVREISNDLQPHLISELGLKEAIMNYIERVNLIPINFKLTFDEEEYLEFMPMDEQLAIFRVLQELVHNIIKHADAENVWVDLRRTDSLLSLEICDDGNGIIPIKTTGRHSDSLGLRNIDSRLEYVGGVITRSTNIGKKGTTVSLQIPLGYEGSYHRNSRRPGNLS
jgi:signal transduction histidine kinase